MTQRIQRTQQTQQSLLLLNGPNLNRLGRRDPQHYGRTTLAEIEALTAEAAQCYGLTVHAYQSNHEGGLIDILQQYSDTCCAVIINPGALTHYSYALHDALIDSGLPAVEVHLSCLAEREAWRQHSVTAAACIDQIDGQRADGYRLAVVRLAAHLHLTLIT